MPGGHQAPQPPQQQPPQETCRWRAAAEAARRLLMRLRTCTRAGAWSWRQQQGQKRFLLRSARHRPQV